MKIPKGTDLFSRLKWPFSYLILLSFVLVLCIIPIISLISVSLFPDGGQFTFSEIERALNSDRSMGIIKFTIVQAIISTAVTLAAALPGAYLLSRYKFVGKAAILALGTVPFVLPSLVLAMGFISLLGSNGTINGWIENINSFSGLSLPALEIIFTKQGIVLAHIFFNFPIALRILHSRFDRMDGNIQLSARSLGSSRLRTFFLVIVPQMRYALLAAGSLIFTFCLLSFGVVLVIGGITNATIEVEIYRQFTGRLDFELAGSLLLIESVLVLFSTLVYIWSTSKEGDLRNITLGSGLSGSEVGGRKVLRSLLIFVYILIISVLIIGPLLSVVETSFHRYPEGPTEYSLHWYGRVLDREDDPVLGVSPFGAVINSILFGFLTITISLPLSFTTALLMRRRRFLCKSFLDAILLFPLGVSTVALGYGLIKIYSGGTIPLVGTWMIVVLVHAVIAFPFGARSLYNAMQDI
ncbi:MAG: iron ABC transporter permease, partial [Thermoplasmata archaeon]|nr:iron ABC transporter permease [Thermoplasmata archaeon]